MSLFETRTAKAMKAVDKADLGGELDRALTAFKPVKEPRMIEEPINAADVEAHVVKQTRELIQVLSDREKTITERVNIEFEGWIKQSKDEVRKTTESRDEALRIADEMAKRLVDLEKARNEETSRVQNLLEDTEKRFATMIDAQYKVIERLDTPTTEPAPAACDDADDGA